MVNQGTILGRMSIGVLAFVVSGAAVASEVTPKIRRECHQSQFKNISRLNGVAVRVVDGDTIRFLYRGGDYAIRMVGIDTPETVFSGKSQGYWGERASKRLRELLPEGAPVRIELAGDKCDHFGRILGEVIYQEENLNNRMLEEGLAVNYCFWPEDCTEKADLTRPNVEGKIGMFSGAPFVELPYIWRAEIRNSPHVRWLGNSRTHEVFPPGSFDRVPIADRVFFKQKADVQPPYYFAEE